MNDQCKTCANWAEYCEEESAGGKNIPLDESPGGVHSRCPLYEETEPGQED